MTSIKTAALPSLPTGIEFEELVAALHQGSGLYLERNLIERDEVELLELDIITTDYGARPPVQCLIEVKGGQWGFSDLFKVRGWATYLNIAESRLVAATGHDRTDDYERLASKVGVNVRVIEDRGDAVQAAQSLGLAPVSQSEIACWRYVYWVERRLVERARAWKNGLALARRGHALVAHAFRASSEIFFLPTAADRVSALYSLYSEYRNLAGRCGQEMAGAAFEQEDAKVPADLFSAAFTQCVFNEIQVACWLEHRARLALLKAATDYLCFTEDGVVDRARSIVRWTLGGQEWVMPIEDFPSTFRTGLNALSTEPHFRRYPIVWQWLLGVFGGFILHDFKEQEYAILAARSGIPVSAVPDALRAFDTLFPTSGGWFRVIGASNIDVLLLSSVPMRGVGANYRRLVHTHDASWESLSLTGMFTLSDLTKWNNSVVDLLAV